MESQHPLHGHVRGPLHQIVGWRKPKAIRVPGDNLFSGAPGSVGASHLCNGGTVNARERQMYPGDRR